MNMRARGYARDRGYRPHGPVRSSSIPRELMQLPQPPTEASNGTAPQPQQVAGFELGPFRLRRTLAEGPFSTVYAATMEPDHAQEIALKLLHPSLAARPGFYDRFESTLARVTRMRHQGILPVLHFGTIDGQTYVASTLLSGETLRSRLAQGRFEPQQAVALLRRIAGAVNAANEAGIVHRDLAPGSILFDDRGEPLLTGFGTAPVHLGISVGTPGYLPPEQAQGEPSGREADVYGLGAIAFEMLTGTPPYSYTSTPDLLIATVHSPVPSARQRRAELPPDLDAVLGRAMAKRAADRHRSTLELVEQLAAMNWESGSQIAQEELSGGMFRGSFEGLAAANGQLAAPEAEHERTEARLRELYESALSAAVVVDEGSFVVGWNSRATDLFGWTEEQAVGRTLQSTIVPPQYREAHERGFRRYLETGEAKVLGQVIEITALHRSGKEFPIELSISPAARNGRKALILAFIRDISGEKRAEKLREARRAIDDMLERGPALELAATAMLDILGEKLGWSCGALWLRDGRAQAMHCVEFWESAPGKYRDLEMTNREAQIGPGRDLVGQVWAEGDGVWVEDVLHKHDMPRALPALRGGLHTVVGVPILESGQVRGVMELLSEEVRPQEADVLNALYDYGRRLGRLAGTGADAERRGFFRRLLG